MTDPAAWAVALEPSETHKRPEETCAREIWALPAEDAFLGAFLRNAFENHWEGIHFGPLIEGATYAWKYPTPPERIGLMDGYLAVMFGNGGHFHLGIGENRGSEAHPTPPELTARRKPSRVAMLRGFGADGCLVTWGFEIMNGAGADDLDLLPQPLHRG